MIKKKKELTQEQVIALKESAKKLQIALKSSKDPVAHELLTGELGDIIEQVLSSDSATLIEHVPHFEKMTRDYLPDVEEEYFEFYSLAKYGKPAFEK